MCSDKNDLITDGLLQKGTICRLTLFNAQYLKDKYVLVIVDLDLLDEYGLVDKIGAPVAIESKPPPDMDSKNDQPGNITSNGFYGKPQEAPQQQPQQPQQRALATRPGGGGGGSTTIYPIEALSPYTHKWTIKARCTHKSEIKTWHKASSEGKLFSVTFLDDTGEIRATGFNDAVDTWYEVLQEGSVYYISNPCRVQMAKKQFSNVNHDYELTFESGTMIEKAEDAEGVPKVTFNFVSLADLEGVTKDGNIDCIGVLQDVGEVQSITSKTTSKPYDKRELTLVDNSGYSVRLTIWGKVANSFDTAPESVVAFKGVKVSDFGGRSLSLLSSGSITVNPDIDEAYQLKGWYDGSGRNETFQSHANTMSAATTGGSDRNATKTIAQIKDENLGMGEEADWFTLKATLVYVKNESFAYPACRTEGCNKKVIEETENEWRCEKCQKTWDAPNYRYIMTLNVSDHTGMIWLNCFDEVGTMILGMTANELTALKQAEDNGEAMPGARKSGDVFQEALCRAFNFRCKAKMDNFREEQR